jgi:hypothetical protein
MGKSNEEIRSFLRQCLNIFVIKGQKKSPNIINDSIYNSNLDNIINYVLIRSKYDPSKQYLDVNYSELANNAIKKFSGNINEPEWNIISRQSKLYLLPSEDAIEKYEIDYNGYNPEYEIIIPEYNSSSSFKDYFSSSPSGNSSPNSVSNFFNKGGKRISKRQISKRRISKRRISKRRKFSFRKGRAKK